MKMQTDRFHCLLHSNALILRINSVSVNYDDFSYSMMSSNDRIYVVKRVGKLQEQPASAWPEYSIFILKFYIYATVQ